MIKFPIFIIILQCFSWFSAQTSKLLWDTLAHFTGQSFYSSVVLTERWSERPQPSWEWSASSQTESWRKGTVGG